MPAATPALLAVAGVAAAGVLLLLAGAIALVVGLGWLDQRERARTR